MNYERPVKLGELGNKIQEIYSPSHRLGFQNREKAKRPRNPVQHLQDYSKDEENVTKKML